MAHSRDPGEVQENASAGRENGARSDQPVRQTSSQPTSAVKQTCSGRLLPEMDETSSKGLIDPNGTRTAAEDLIHKLIHLAEGSDEEVIQRLADKYHCAHRPEDLPEYEGEPNAELDRPTTTDELKAELTLMNKTAAPGPDFITARHLFNLEEDAIAQLVDHFYRDYKDLGGRAHS
ncbi:hypothetical protein HPB47_022237 [Ixodes persulcatus]|uniref:Uncharacterized protein n=1 Tax=Ixodes persulcatus TaxID=34615 RepID=A0AC60QA90_IXOPE|nr:hypothetical protein HPB47_022237 [Ixodes persulcatus]